MIRKLKDIASLSDITASEAAAYAERRCPLCGGTGEEEIDDEHYRLCRCVYAAWQDCQHVQRPALQAQA